VSGNKFGWKGRLRKGGVARSAFSGAPMRLVGQGKSKLGRGSQGTAKSRARPKKEAATAFQSTMAQQAGNGAKKKVKDHCCCGQKRNKKKKKEQKNGYSGRILGYHFNVNKNKKAQKTSGEGGRNRWTSL